MTNYNDGKWHGWNGGDCPIHPNTFIECIWGDGSGAGSTRIASKISWTHIPPCTFRVIKEHKEPREWLIAREIGTGREVLLKCEDDARRLGWCGDEGMEIIHVSEVIK